MPSIDLDITAIELASGSMHWLTELKMSVIRAKHRARHVARREADRRRIR